MDIQLSDAEKLYVIHGAQQGIRSDGRGTFDYQPIIVETGVLPTANGSARVRLGSTDLLIGIKADLVVVDDMSSYSNRLNFSIDCSANATPKFAGMRYLNAECLGRGGDEFGVELASALNAAYDNPFVLPDLAKLIVSPMHAWKIYVDIVILQFGGNVLDTASIGVKAALSDTEICEVLVRPGDAGKKVVDILDENKVWKLDTSRQALVFIRILIYCNLIS
uniref:Ribosomal RNA-processing protein 42 n=1 Tax=Syphacia muris TaxID=451379 RepID=A0A0N5AZ04_9BILA